MSFLSFFKSKKRKVTLDNLAFLGSDMHAHFLPGIDDGAATVEDSLKLIDGFIDLGYRQIIGTPHVMGDIHKNTPETIINSYNILKEELDKKGYTIPVHYAAEYLIDEQFEEKIKSGPLLTFGDNYVLVETMFYGKPLNLKEILFALEMQGYQPVLAHPERYHYLLNDFNELEEQLEDFLNSGVLLQTNLLALTGYYGPRERELAELLIDKGLISFLGTDMHHPRHLKNLQQFTINEKTANQILEVQFKNKTLL